ncbi:hypothetical protein, partial [Parapedobacter soli]|uniref:hypothetical protein n=1 Tax=Parapedobacter soli TaxID=416955 RepID=UPI0021C8E440
TYTYFNEGAFDEEGNPVESLGVIIDVPESVINNFEEIYNDIVNEGITVNDNFYETFEDYLTTIVNSNTNFEDNEFITVTGSGTEGDPFEITIIEGDANSMLITNEDGDLEWAT